MARIQSRPTDFEPTGIIVTYDELVECFDNVIDGADYAQAAEGGVINALKLEHGFKQYDDIELIIDYKGEPPVEKIIETHIWCLEIEIQQILEKLTYRSMLKVTTAHLWVVLDHLNGYHDSEIFHSRDGLEWILDLFQVDLTYEQAVEKYGAKIEDAIQEYLDWCLNQA